MDSEGYPSTLTAAHCGPLGTEVYTPFDSGYKFGQLWWTWASHDIGLIWIYHGNVGGIVYTGPWNSDYGRGVTEAGPNYTGN